MDNILRHVELLSRDELVWLSTYLSGRLRAWVPPGDFSGAAQAAFGRIEARNFAWTLGNARVVFAGLGDAPATFSVFTPSVWAGAFLPVPRCVSICVLTAKITRGMWTWSMMITHVTIASKGCLILPGNPLLLGVPHLFGLVTNYAINAPGKSVVFDIFTMSVLATGATFTRAVSLPPGGEKTLILILLWLRLRMERVLRE